MKIFGQHEPATLAQLTDVASRAARAALMADGHVGYVMPIGGVAAYRDKVSVVGVGFDIACIAAGTPVLTADGTCVPIEGVTDADAALCWDGRQVRRIAPLIGAVARGTRDVVRLRLANGRELVGTGDHRVLTRRGWRELGALCASGGDPVADADRGDADEVACLPHLGLPAEPWRATVLEDLEPPARDPLRERGLLPLRGDDPRLPALVRLLGVVSGDGHLARDGKAVSVYTVWEEDARAIADDFGRIGFRAAIYRRARAAGRRDELCVRVTSRALHALFAALGSPVGRKAWPAMPMPWLLDAPAWVRAQFMSGFASAEMMTPRLHASGVVPNLQLKQAGADDHAIRFVARLLESLGFVVSVAPSGKPYGERRVWVAQLIGGRRAQVAFFERVGFCHAAGKRRAAARVASVAWAEDARVARRAAARDEARALHAAGGSWRAVTADVARRYGVSAGFAYHAIYDRRGTPRAHGERIEPQVDGETCWVPVVAVEPAGTCEVHDVVTGDAAESFVANGIVVHNCGNAAIRTDRTLADLGDDPARVRLVLNHLADEIAETVSFGVGRRNRADDAPVDHALFEDASWDALPKKEREALRKKARDQLGTVGSGNHYVDVFADEAGALWVGVHFGSRGFGHAVASGFLAMGQGKAWGERAPEREVLLDVRQPMGHDYWHLMNLAGRYAYAGREWVARKVVDLMGARELELVHNHHNFAWREEVEGEELLVVRKGATPAFPGQTGFIGGSMGDDAVIVRGRVDAPEEVARAQRASLFSTVHGAGRVMSRSEAAGKRKGWGKNARIVRPGKVTPEMLRSWIDAKGVILRGGGLDESPHVYRRLPDVLAAQEGTIEVLHTLRPLVVVMAGADEFDPYKD